MKRKLSNKLLFILLWIFLILSFSMLAIFVLYEANGYRLNKSNWHLEQTGLISLDGLPKQADVTINGKLVSKTLPFRIQKVFPGSYTVIVGLSGYNSWTKSVKVTGGQAYENKKVYLYLANPEVRESTRTIKPSDIQNDTKNQSSDIQILNSSEIWYKKDLITRFSQPVYHAILTDDRLHIIFQVGKELRVIELDGGNNTKLFDLPENKAYDFALYSDKILFVDQDKIKEVEIR